MDDHFYIDPTRVLAVLRGERREAWGAEWFPVEAAPGQLPTWDAIVGMNLYRIAPQADGGYLLMLGTDIDVFEPLTPWRDMVSARAAAVMIEAMWMTCE